MKSHVTSVLVTLTEPAADAPPLPTFMLFSADPLADARLLDDFVPVVVGKPRQDGVRLTWGLPDPALTLGHADLSREQAAAYQAHNQASRAVRLLFARDTPGTTEQVGVTLDPFYADWLGASDDAAFTVPVSGWGRRQARALREKGQMGGAVRALLAGLHLAMRPDGSLTRPAAYDLHEAALLAQSLTNDEAWEYFEMVALMTYPNCHDALIGLALRAQDAPDQAVPLFARAYAIRPREKDLRLYALAVARAGQHAPKAARQAILDRAAGVDFAAPLFRDNDGKPLNIPPAEILAHLRALGGGP